MKRLKECMRAFVEALGRVGKDCRADLLAVWTDFPGDMAQLWADLCRDGRVLLIRCREMVLALAAEVRRTVTGWIG